MVGDWTTKSLGEVLTLQRGFDLPENDRKPGRYRIIASTGPVGTHGIARVKGPGVVIGRSGSIGGGQYVKEDFWPLNTTLWVKDFKGNSPRFCYYLLKSMDLGLYNAGSGVPTLNRNHIHPIPVLVPVKVEEQNKIAQILGSLDDKIELNRRVSETMDGMARAIFKSWFVDFNPVRAKTAGKPTGLHKKISALFPPRLVDSELGEIPEGWTIKEVGDLAEIVGGTTPSTKKPEYWEAGHHAWATPKDFSALKAPVLLSTERRITDAGLAEIGSGLLPVGAVLLSSRAPIGYLAITEIPVAINQGFVGMKPKKEIPSEFLLLWCHFFKDTILGRANGSTFLEISKSNFRSIPLLCPSNAVLKAFSDLVSPFYRKVAINEKETRTLISQRDTLLPKLMSGELRV